MSELNLKQFEALNNLTSEEKEVALAILKEIGEKGYSEQYNDLIYSDYEEIPVDIETFLFDKNYLGNGLIDAEGRKTVFPFWVETLKKIFPNNVDTAYNTLILTGAIGIGKAQPLDSLVLTDSGFKTMGSLTYYDKVYGPDGDLHSILGIFPQGTKNICKVSFSDGTSTLCCDEHLWDVYNIENKGWITVETKQLINENLKSSWGHKYFIPMTEPVKFKHRDVDVDPYVLGILIGNNSLSEDNSPHNEYKFIPEDYLYNDVDSRIALLQGLMDINGYVNKDEDIIGFSTTNEKLKDNFIFLVQSLGGTCKVSGLLQNNVGAYYNIDIRIPKWIPPFRLAEKLNKVSSDRLSPYRYIVDIEYVGEEECQCIYIHSNEHLYMTNDFIVTHNTLVAIVAELYMMYKMLCLKDPYLYFGMQPIDKISFSMISYTLDQARGVAWDKMQQLLQSSPWFMSHGKITGTDNLVWKPIKRPGQIGTIELVVGSKESHITGRAVYCLDGDTEIVTVNGINKLKDLVNKNIQVVSVDESGNKVISDNCTVEPTVISEEEYDIELEDGTILKCTPNHKFLLEDGTYKEAKYLTEEDELFDVTKNMSNVEYLVVHHIIPRCRVEKVMKIKSIKKITLPEPKQFYDVIEAAPHHNFLIKTNFGYIVSHNCAFTDEVNFSAVTTDVDKIKRKMLNLITKTDARMISRFQRGNKLPTLNIIASSKNSDQSFLDQYIETKKKNESKTSLIIDEAQWVVDDRKNMKEKFWVAVGNKFQASEVLPKNATEELVRNYRDKGYQMLQVPYSTSYWDAFNASVEIALNDLAGISTVGARKYIAGHLWKAVKTDSYRNPFSRDTISVGTAENDAAQYSDFFDLSAIPEDMKRIPMFLHLDLSSSKDKTGIAGVWVLGKKPGVEVPTPKEVFYKVAFSVSVEAPKGYQISFEKNRIFIRWLREQGFKIKGVSFDTFQSTHLMQQLNAEKFNPEVISVDRLEGTDEKDENGNKHKICKPYEYFHSTLYERRMQVYDRCDLLTEEVLGLERQPDGHINHPDNGTVGSKDQIDAVVGAMYNASLHIEEIDFEFGAVAETFLDTFIEANGGLSDEEIKKQVIADFEKELLEQHRPANVSRQTNTQQGPVAVNGLFIW